MEHLETARLLDAQRPQIVDATVGALLHEPFWTERFGPGIGERLSVDTDANLAALIKSVRYRSPMIFDDHMLWRRNQVVSLGCSTGHVREAFGHIWEAITRSTPAYTQGLIYQHLHSGLQALSYTNAAAQALASKHEALAEALTATTYDAHHHWQAAYGEGRGRVLYDAWFAIDSLIDSLGIGSADVLAQRMRWSRQQLQRRGLATTHSQQQLWLLAEAIEPQLPPSAAAEARRTLEHAAAALEPAREASRALLAAQGEIVAEVAGLMLAQGLAPQPALAAMEVGWYLAYLCDSVEATDASPLAGYCRWMQGWLADQGLPDTPLRQALAALGNAADRLLPQYAAIEAHSIIRAAQPTF